MIRIPLEDIKTLLKNYENATANLKKSPFRSVTGSKPHFIKELNETIKLCPSNEINIPNEYLYSILLLLLSRKTRKHFLSDEPKLSEKLALAIEDKFGVGVMKSFRSLSNPYPINLYSFNFIMENFDSNDMPPESEGALQHLINQKNKPIDTSKQLGHIRDEDKANDKTHPSKEVLEKVLEQEDKLSLFSRYMHPKDLANASRVSKDFKNVFNPKLRNIQAMTLAEYIIHADYINADKMITSAPILLTTPVTVTDYSSRKVHGTPLQLALGAKDIGIQENELGMIEMIHNHLSKLPNGEALIAEQIHEQFPEGWEKKMYARVRRDSEAVTAFFNALLNSKNEPEMKEAAAKYRKHFDNENLGRGLIKTGFHNNELAVSEWFKCYEAVLDKYTQPENFNQDKIRFFWQKGSYPERYLTTVDMMALVNDIKFIIADKINLDRILIPQLHPTNQSPYFPLDPFPGQHLGDNCGIGRSGPTQEAFQIWRNDGLLSDLFSELSRIKTIKVVRFINKYINQPKSMQRPAK